MSKNSKKKDNRGRKSSITPKKVAKLIAAFQRDMTVEEACRQAKISTDSYHRRMKNDVNFATKMLTAQDYVFALAKDRIVDLIKKDKSGYITMEFLKRRQKERYSERVEATGVDGAPIMNGTIILKPFAKRNEQEPTNGN